MAWSMSSFKVKDQICKIANNCYNFVTIIGIELILGMRIYITWGAHILVSAKSILQGQLYMFEDCPSNWNHWSSDLILGMHIHHMRLHILGATCQGQCQFKCKCVCFKNVPWLGNHYRNILGTKHPRSKHKGAQFKWQLVKFKVVFQDQMSKLWNSLQLFNHCMYILCTVHPCPTNKDAKL